MRNILNKNFLIVSAAVLLITVYFIAGVLVYANNQYNDLNIGNLERAVVMLNGFAPADLLEDEEAAAAWAYSVSVFSQYRITLISSGGRIIFDSDADIGVMENHLERLEFQSAVRQGVGTDRRRSATLGEYHFYAAVALYNSAGEFSGVLRLSRLIPGFFYRLLSFLLPFLAFGFLVILGTCAGLYRYSRLLSLSVEANLDAQLQKKTEELEAKAKEAAAVSFHREVILNSMFEGIITLDKNLNIILANPRLCAQFGKEKNTPEAVRGMSLLEFSGSLELAQAAALAISSGKAQELTVKRYLPDARQYFQVFAAPLQDGAVMALRDTSRLVKLEAIRKDFVANVSHELRTPIQVIQGFAENILVSDMDDKEQIHGFTQIIARNAKSMENLTNDLLVLASLEDEDAQRPPLEETSLVSAIGEAVDMLAAAAHKKGITVEVSCPPDLRAKIYKALFVHALVNLLDNAIKYSDNNSQVRLAAFQKAAILHLEKIRLNFLENSSRKPAKTNF
ncbi:MAG: PAS domain-containing protein [Spirochaetes bacterium]|nr:PAS domain-containing protein [Spirochaetota bacterium]